MTTRGAAPGSAEMAKRVLILLLLVGAFFTGYFAIGWSADPEDGISLATPLDAAIPLVPSSILVYAWVYTAAISPLFVVRCPELFRRVALAYALVIGASLACFATLTVTAVGLRPDEASLDTTRFTSWGLRLAYALDPPVNLFPSVHLAAASLAALAAWKARPLYGAIALPVVLLVAISICTTKQHYAIDGFAGAALALASYALVVRPYRPAADAASAWGWRGPIAYLAVHSLVYWAAWLAFRAGFAPWQGGAV